MNRGGFVLHSPCGNLNDYSRRLTHSPCGVKGAQLTEDLLVEVQVLSWAFILNLKLIYSYFIYKVKIYIY